MTSKAKSRDPQALMEAAAWRDIPMPAPGETEAFARQCRIMGVLVGQACGDALGAGYETGRPVPPGGAAMVGGGFGFAPGQFTDDTEQAVRVAVVRSEPLAVAAQLLSWYRGNPRDVGSQTRAVLSRASTPRGVVMASRAYARRQAGLPRPHGWFPGSGNGSLMRTGPVCLPFLGDRERIAKAARQVSDLTHASPWDGDSCVIWSLLVDSAIAEGPAFGLATALREAIAFPPEDRRGFWESMTAEALRHPPAKFRRGNGSAVGCYMAALSAVAHAESLEDGLKLAVAAGGDCDTTASVAGALLGAWHGVLEIPRPWWQKVWGRGPASRMAARDLCVLALEAARLTTRNCRWQPLRSDRECLRAMQAGAGRHQEGGRAEGGQEGGVGNRRHLRAVRRDHRAVGISGVCQDPGACGCGVFRHVGHAAESGVPDRICWPSDRGKPGAPDVRARRPRRFRAT